MTIGAVCKALEQEFPTSRSRRSATSRTRSCSRRGARPAATASTAGDVARLRTILRLQRDEFLPLRVIRQELALGRADADVAPAPAATAPRGAAPPERHGAGRGALYSLEDVVEETRAEPRSSPSSRTTASSRARARRREVLRRDRARDRARGHRARPLRRRRAATCGVSGPAADREAALLQQILAPALRSRNAQRRKEAVEALENLAAVTTHLKHLLLIRDLRKIVG
jgi:hypothetical protein